MIAHRPGKVITVEVAGVGGGIYQANDSVGLKTEIPDATGGGNESATIVSVSLIEDDTSNAAATDIFFFSDEPTPTSADEDAVAWPQSDALNLLGVVKILASDYGAAAASAIGVASGGVPFKIKSGIPVGTKTPSKSIWAIVVTRGAPTYSSQSVSLKVGIEYE